MKLLDIITEEAILASLQNGQKSNVYKNPTEEELNKVSMNGIVKGILTQDGFIAFDFQNIDVRDLPRLHGYPIVLFFGKGEEVTVELFHHIPLDQKNFEKYVRANSYLKKFNIKNIIVNSDEIDDTLRL